MAAAPVAPESQGNSISAPPGTAAPGAGQTGPDPMSAPPALTAPVDKFAPKATGSAGTAINDYRMGVLQATAQGGMQQQKAFQQAHDAMIAARTGAMTQAAQRATAVFGQPGDGAAGAAMARASQTEGSGIRLGNSDQHQADFKASAKQRDMAFGNYMKEVQSVIPLAQAAAYKDVQAKFAAQKQASAQSQYDTAVGVGQQQMDADTSARDSALSQAQPKLAAVAQQIANITQQNQEMQSDLAEMQKKNPSGTGLLSMGKYGATGGPTFDQARVDRTKAAIAKNQQRLTDLQGQQGQLSSDIDAKTPAPKSLADYVTGLTKGGSPQLIGKATLGQPALVSGQDRLGKATATSDVARILSYVPGIKLPDAKAIAGNPDYSSARDDANAGLSVATDSRGRIPGTQNTPWDAFVSHINSQFHDSATRTALIKEFQPLYHQAGRDKQMTAKQQKAKK